MARRPQKTARRSKGNQRVAANLTADAPLVVDVFWSMRSPYCYIALDRILEMQKQYNVEMSLRPVWPIAIWDPDFFKGIKLMEYRASYQDLDTARSAFFNDVPYQYPDPDPVAQKPNFGPVLPIEQQDKIKLLTYTAAGAAQMGKGWDYLNQVSRMMWNGTVKGWDQGTHLRDAIQRAGIDADKLIGDVQAKPKKYDALVERNHQMQTNVLTGHTGVPLFAFNDEPFFGQDRMDQLLWRLKQYGLTERSAAVTAA